MSEYLIDTNILVRLVLPQDALNKVAVGAVDELKRRGEKTCVAPQNLIEFWSVADAGAQDRKHSDLQRRRLHSILRSRRGRPAKPQVA